MARYGALCADECVRVRLLPGQAMALLPSTGSDLLDGVVAAGPPTDRRRCVYWVRSSSFNGTLHCDTRMIHGVSSSVGRFFARVNVALMTARISVVLRRDVSLQEHAGVVKVSMMMRNLEGTWVLSTS